MTNAPADSRSKVSFMARLAVLPKTIRSARFAYRVILEASPRDTVVATVIGIAGVLTPALLLVLQRLLVDRLVATMSSGSTEIWTATIVVTIVALTCLYALGELRSTVEVQTADRLREHTRVVVNTYIFRHTASFRSLELHESPDNLNRLRLAQDGVRCFKGLSWSLIAVASGWLSILPVAIVIGRIAWWIPVVLFLSIYPMIRLFMGGAGREWTMRERLTEQQRRADILAQIGTDTEFARDIRLFDVDHAIIKRWEQSITPVATSLANVFGNIVRLSIAFAPLSAAGLGFVLWWTISRVGNDVSVGDVAIVIPAIQAFRQALWSMTGNTEHLWNDLIGIGKFREFLALRPSIERTTVDASPLPRLTNAITLEDVSFRYPGTEQTVCEHLSLTLQAGHSVALVGANGAGKTTIARLLSRLFDIQQGRICWDELDMAALDPDSLRYRLAVVPQDFARFPLSLRDNVAIGRMDVPPDDDEIMDVLKRVGLAGQLTDRALALDTPLTRELDGGVQLSGGQWQRLAIARAMIRADQADLFILDEPTAALDPHTEIGIARTMLEMSAGKTTLIISHRLGICTLVDRVLVLDHGRIIEDGSHSELLAANGVYAAMFRSQADWYRELPGAGHVPHPANP